MDIQSILDNLIFANLLFVTISYWASLIFPKFNLLYNFSAIKVIENKEVRFFLLQYPLTNLLMVFLITVGWSLSKFTVDSRKKFLRIGIFYGLGLMILIYRAIKLKSM